MLFFATALKKLGSEPFVIGVLAVLTASALSSVGWILEEQAISRLAPLPVVCVSHLLGGACLLLLGLWRSKKPLVEAARAVTFPFFLFSVVRCAALSLLFGYCLTLTSSSKIMFLTKIEPYVVLLIQIVFHGHRTSVAHLALLAAHVAGAIVLSTGGVFHLSADIAGDLLIFAAVVVNAMLYAPSQRYTRDMGAMYASGFSQLIGGAVLLPFMVALSMPMFAFTEAHLIGWAYMVATVLVFYVASSSLWFFSLTEVPAWLASALRCVGPLIAAPIAWLVFNKGLTVPQSLGAVTVVLTSMLMVVLEKRKR